MDNTKILLSLGAGFEQESAILKALERGFNIVAIDGYNNANVLKDSFLQSKAVLSKKGKILEAICHSLHDIDYIASICSKYNIAGILPQPLGCIIRVSGIINDRFNFRGISYASTSLFTNKYRVHQRQALNNLTTATQYDIETNPHDITYPCIIKPVHGSGSRGVVISKDESSLQNAILRSNEEISYTDSLVIEEYIDGDEYSVSMMIVDNKCIPFTIIAKRLTKEPYRQEVEYFDVDTLSDIDKEIIYKAAFNSARALLINDSLITCDLIYTKDKKAYVIDIAGRPNGNRVLDFLEAKGISIINLYIDAVIENKELKYTIDNTHSYCMRFFDLKEGYVVKVPDLIDNDNIVKCVNNLKVGDKLDIVKAGRDLIYRGYIIAKGKDSNEARSICQQFIDSFIID